eukprot:TRINITY_DN5903_c0_g1_i1.p1 TRINITY_DN5903_c0_g1~~TRINITY_DN5903_c0_g1_i1.p1  ORF type:complete len:200 (+),score=49.52 TRINITY_DN5903_c0_g1_i1:143-742(+)
MKLFSLMVLKWKDSEEPVILSSAFDLSSFNYFQRGNMKELMTFMSRTLAKRCPAGTRQQVEKESYVAYVHSRTDGLAAVLTCDKDYPDRVAFVLCGKILTDFEKFRGQFEGKCTDHCIAGSPQLEADLVKYQDPSQADQIMKIQKDLDETRTIMHQAIDDLLERGEKIDDLVAKSGDLGVTSKGFYTAAKGNNSCCKIM